MERRSIRKAGFVLALILISGCADEAPETSDSICQSEEAQETGLQVSADDQTFFYADSPEGDQVGFERGGSVLELDPGDYQVRINSSRYPVTIRSGQITRCTASSIVVTGSTDAYYYMLDSLGTQLAFATLGEPLWLFAGSYIAKLNDTRVEVTLPWSGAIQVASGTVVVTGTTDEYYYVDDAGGTQLAFATLDDPMSVFPGSYAARLNSSVSSFTVNADDNVVVASGTVLGAGTTEEYYYILDVGGNQLGFARLGDSSAYLPGEYQVRVSGTIVPIGVQPNAVTEITTGTLVVPGAESEYYYILDEAGSQLAFNRLGMPTSLVPGVYSVRVADRTASVTITPGSTTTSAP